MLQASLSKTYEDLHANIPTEVSAPIKRAATNNKATFYLSSTIQIGDVLPPFNFPDATGKQISSTDILSQGPLLIAFYRGSWYPFCNLTLQAFQSSFPTIAAKGVSFPAITAELPDTSLAAIEKEGLPFSVLSDVENAYARQLGLVFKQPDELGEAFKGLGIDWEKRYGNDDFELAVPATLLVDRTIIVRKMFINTEYWKRLDPKTALKVSFDESEIQMLMKC